MGKMWGNPRIGRTRQTARNPLGNRTPVVINPTEVEKDEEFQEEVIEDVVEGVVEVEDALSVGVLF